MLGKKTFKIGTFNKALHENVFNLILDVISFLRASFINFNLDPCMLSIQYFSTWLFTYLVLTVASHRESVAREDPVILVGPCKAGRRFLSQESYFWHVVKTVL